jgi:general nucleoside transport system permease protein
VDAEQSFVISTIARSLASSTPLLFGALGEVYAERAGVVNLGMEGMMALGALGAFAVTQTTGNPMLGILAGAIVGMLASLLHAFVSITLKANQSVSGLALTMLGLGLAGLLGRSFEGLPLFTKLENVSLPGLSSIPVIGQAAFTDQSPLTYVGIILALVLWVVLFQTRVGIVIRSVGENPAAADALGINVVLVRYGCVLFGGLMAGLAGAFISIAYRPSWTEGTISGYGWIALALAIFAAWNPLGALAGSLFFGALIHLEFRLQDSIAPEILHLMPYAMVILALSLNALRKGSRNAAPESLGIPYQRGQR